MSDDATFTQIGDGYTLKIERQFPQAIDRVWSALIVSDERANWLASGDVELRVGAQFTFAWTNTGDTMESTVLAVDPPRLIEFYWHQEQSTDSVVRWELEPANGGTRFTLTHSVPTTAYAPDLLSGWHTHVEMLGLYLKDEPSPWVWSRWRDLKEHYIELLKREGIDVTSPGRQFDDDGNELTETAAAS